MNRLHTIITHRDPDIDEIEAIRILKRHGEKTYPGVSEAVVKTVGKRDSVGKNVDELEAEGTLCVGIGGGRFDEHPFGDRTRRDGECAATLVAKYIGADQNPALRANIAYALKRNYSADTGEFEIAPLAKLAFRYLSHSGDASKDAEMENQILSSCFFLLNAVEDNETALTSGKAPEKKAVKSMSEYITEWMLKRFSVPTSKDQVFYWIMQYAKKHGVADDGKVETSFDLADLVTLAQRFSYSEEDLVRAIDILLDAIWHKYRNFFVDCKRDFDSPTTRGATIERGAEKFLVTSVLSSNPEIAKYCRSQYGRYAGVVIKRDPTTGNTQIFFNQKYGLDPKPIARELRVAERKVKGLTDNLDNETLVSQGKVAGAEEWYFDGFQLLNGSHTADEVPTRLSREEVEQAVMRGLRSIPGIL
jgi:hypothetical protein